MAANRGQRRKRRRVALAAMALCLWAAALPLGAGYRRLCAGPLDTYPILAAARDAARSEAADAGRTAVVASRSVAGIVARWRAVALDALLRLKQADQVAFPLHAAAAMALEVGGCPAVATGDQWRKAAAHAWCAPAAQLAAAGLRRTAGAERAAGDVLAELAEYARAEPWHAANLARVAQAYPYQ